MLYPVDYGLQKSRTQLCRLQCFTLFHWQLPVRSDFVFNAICMRLYDTSPARGTLENTYEECGNMTAVPR